MKIMSLSQAVEKIQSSQRIFIHGGAAVPLEFLQEIVRQQERLTGLEFIHLHLEGPYPYEGLKKEKFNVVNLFVGSNLRDEINFDSVDYLPCFLSEMDQLFRKNIRRPHVALIHVSPPDQHGYCSLGSSVDIARAAVETADVVLALINPRVPRTFGDGVIHQDLIDAGVLVERPLLCHEPSPPSDIERKIGKIAADLIEDGSTLQAGIGAIPDSVLYALQGHKNLGVHTEMWSDGLLPLLEKGVVNNSEKNINPGKTVSSFITGSERVMKFINDNPSVILKEAREVNNPRVIAKNNKVVAINSAVEIDLTGQVCADSVGSRIISGVGGQVDFIRGASLSVGGKPFIAITSRSKKGKSRIVPQLHLGSGVVTTRAHIHYVCTEYGAADLYGKTLGERAKELIKIAHPDDRADLEKFVFQVKRGSQNLR